MDHFTILQCTILYHRDHHIIQVADTGHAFGYFGALQVDLKGGRQKGLGRLGGLLRRLLRGLRDSGLRCRGCKEGAGRLPFALISSMVPHIQVCRHTCIYTYISLLYECVYIYIHIYVACVMCTHTSIHREA